jgi:hypothetical protein
VLQVRENFVEWRKRTSKIKFNLMEINDFHHVNPSEKEYEPSDMLMLKKEKFLKS